MKKNNWMFTCFMVLIFLNSLGFPGNYVLLFGGRLSDATLIDYICFAAEILMMLLVGAAGYREIVLLDLKPRYSMLYLFLLYVVVDSLWMAEHFSEEAVTMIRLTVTLLFALWVVEHYTVQELLRLLCTAQAIFLVATVLFLLIRPDLAYRTYQFSGSGFTGLFDAKNKCATELSFGIAFAVLTYRMADDRGERKALLLLILSQLLLLIPADSLGALAATLLVLLYLCVLEPMLEDRFRLPIGWLVTLGSVGFPIFSITVLPLFSGMLKAFGKDATLTGRVDLWKRVILVMSGSHTMTGYGYAGFWRNESAVSLIQHGFDKYSFLGNITTGAHNFVMELWLNLGLLGILLLYFTILVMTGRVFEMERDSYLFCVTFFLLFLVKGFTERMLVDANGYDVLFLFLSLGYAGRRPSSRSPLGRQLQ